MRLIISSAKSNSFMTLLCLSFLSLLMLCYQTNIMRSGNASVCELATAVDEVLYDTNRERKKLIRRKVAFF